MSFPTTSVLDNFNRADENPLSGSGRWAVSGTFNTPFQILSNLAEGTSNTKINQDSYVAAGDLFDCEVYVTISTLPTSGHYIGVVARQDPTSNTGKNLYQCVYIAGVGVEIDWIDSSGSVNTLGSYAQIFSVGDSIGLSIQGTTLTAWYKPSGGSWTNLGGVTDANLTHGYIGVTNFPAAGGGELDDFGGGAIAIVDSNTIANITIVISIDENPDFGTVTGITTPSSLGVQDQHDSAIITSITGIGATEVTTTETLVVLETDTGLAVGDTITFVVSSTTITTTSTTDIPTPPIENVTYAVTITTTDYNNQLWITAYGYDSGAAVTAGTQASFDGDDGLIPIAT